MSDRTDDTAKAAAEFAAKVVEGDATTEAPDEPTAEDAAKRAEALTAADKNRKAMFINAKHERDAAIAEVDEAKETLKFAKANVERLTGYALGLGMEVCVPPRTLFTGVGAAPEQGGDDGTAIIDAEHPVPEPDGPPPLPDPLACQICEKPVEETSELALCDACNRWICAECDSHKGYDCTLCDGCLKECEPEPAGEATTAEPEVPGD